MPQTSFGPNGFEGNSYLRMSSGATGGHSAFVPRTIQWGHAGSGSTQNITVSVSEFGFNQTGGAFYVGGHGWQTDECYAMIAYQNAGSSGGITSVRVNNFMSQTNITLSASIAGATSITLTLSNTHTNGHGWSFYIWGPR